MFGGGDFKVIVFSKEEQRLYAKAWDMPINSFVYVPYGEWNDDIKVKTISEDKGYYFSGGYSNRDYVSLIQVFQGRKDHLIIAASKQNIELVDYLNRNVISDNITIKFDISQVDFDELLCNSHGVIFVMKHNTGASGQMVLLNAMKNRKIIFATYTDCINEYVQDAISAVVADKSKLYESLVEFLETRDSKEDFYKKYVDAAHEKYLNAFSYEAISNSLVNQITKI